MSVLKFLFFKLSLNINLMFLFLIELTVIIAQYKFCRWLDTNRGPLVSNVTALPTEPQPSPDHSTFLFSSITNTWTGRRECCCSFCFSLKKSIILTLTLFAINEKFHFCRGPILQNHFRLFYTTSKVNAWDVFRIWLVQLIVRIRLRVRREAWLLPIDKLYCSCGANPSNAVYW